MSEETYIESPQLRHIRRHEEDKINNPSRHYFDKDIYTKEDSICFECFNEVKHLFVNNYKNYNLERIK